jgi:hypothetical protein
VGDVSSFYIDAQIQENFLNLAKERESLYNLAYSFGYRPKLSYASTTEIDIFQLIPSNNGNLDLTYSLLIPANTTITNNVNFLKFITTEDADFSSTSSVDISYYNEDFFLAKKTIPVISAEVKTVTATFPPNNKFASTSIKDSNLLQILEVTGNDGDRWYEVTYLAQETIFEPSTNINSSSDGIDHLIKIKRVPKRFVTRVKSTGSIELQFGAGVSNRLDDDIIPTPDNINLGLISSVSENSENYNKASIYFSKNYGHKIQL